MRQILLTHIRLYCTEYYHYMYYSTTEMSSRVHSCLDGTERKRSRCDFLIRSQLSARRIHFLLNVV